MFRSNEPVLTQALIKKHIDLVTPISVVLKEKIAVYQALFEEIESQKPPPLQRKILRTLMHWSDSDAVSERENAA
ncbi:hypothetical protein LNP24_29095, partial [Klebsiella pneumoniae subsp. pneumoniae]|nr:hypothetical protein [Klebsiella pneumoniae subsp. pneumoniae]